MANVLDITKNEQKFKVTGNPFWKKYDRWEAHTFKAFDQFLDPEHSFVDIGAWIGSTCLYGAQLSQFCYAIEPDPEAFAELKQNTLLNNFRNLIAIPSCISDKDETQRLYAHPVHGWNASMSSLINNFCKHVDVQAQTLVTFFEQYQIKNCNFIKIDTEGAEVRIIPAGLPVFELDRPTIHLSIHPKAFTDRKEDTDLILDTLSFYKNIFYKEKKVTPQEIYALSQKHNHFDLIFTDR